LEEKVRGLFYDSNLEFTWKLWRNEYCRDIIVVPPQHKSKLPCFSKCILITVAVVDQFHNHTDIIVSVVVQLYSYNLPTVSDVSL
jgi:hypothetical protein